MHALAGMDATERLLRDCIIADPSDDVARLALADRLEELGGAGGYAEFLRMDVLCQYLRPEPDRVNRLMYWFPGCWPVLHEEEFRSGFYDPDGENDLPTALIDRGMPKAVRCPEYLWLKDGPVIARDWPVEEVRLLDVVPEDYTSSLPALGHAVYEDLEPPVEPRTEGARGRLSPAIWSLLEGCRTVHLRKSFDTRALADAAVSKSALLWARRQVDGPDQPTREPSAAASRASSLGSACE